MDYESQTLISRVQELRDLSVDDNTLRQKYNLRDVSYWNLPTARARLSEIDDVGEFLRPYCYRPFDFRYVYYHKAICERLRIEVMQHMKNDNLAFLTHRPQSPKDFSFAYCTRMIGDQNVAANKSVGGGNSFQFPLYRYPTEDTTQQKSLLDISLWPPDEANGGRTPNLNPDFVAEMAQKLGLTFIPNAAGDLQTTFGPEDIFHYIYAVFHSPTYRTRYAEFLKIDFPRVPLTSDVELFRSLCKLGEKLVGLHLLESPEVGQFITRYPIAGDNRVEKGYPKYAAPKDGQSGRVNINPSQYFEGVPPEVWEFYIGGYQVPEKWLKDRRGRQLSYDDLTHYQQVVVALQKTIELMAEIDNAIPEWPMQ
jgi:predicted helicase